MADQAKELRRFRAWAKKQRLDLERSMADRREFMWGDTQLAWETWLARAEHDTPGVLGTGGSDVN